MLVERHIPRFVADEQARLGIEPQLANHGMIGLRSMQLIEHVHGVGEEHAMIGLARLPADDLRQQRLADTGIADDDDVSPLAEKIEIEQPQNTRLGLLTGLVMRELKRIDGLLGDQSGASIAALNRAVMPRAQFDVG